MVVLFDYLYFNYDMNINLKFNFYAVKIWTLEYWGRGEERNMVNFGYD